MRCLYKFSMDFLIEEGYSKFIALKLVTYH